MVPIDGGTWPTEVRGKAASEDRLSKGHAMYRKIGCATLSFCDEHGDRISAIRFRRGRQFKKFSLKDKMSKDINHILALRPALRLATIIVMELGLTVQNATENRPDEA